MRSVTFIDALILGTLAISTAGAGEPRSLTVKHEFQRQHPCPSTGHTSGACPGYVVDHVKALKHGGADRPSNMQWQTVAEAKAAEAAGTDAVIAQGMEAGGHRGAFEPDQAG